MDREQQADKMVKFLIDKGLSKLDASGDPMASPMYFNGCALLTLDTVNVLVNQLSDGRIAMTAMYGPDTAAFIPIDLPPPSAVLPREASTEEFEKAIKRTDQAARALIEEHGINIDEAHISNPNKRDSSCDAYFKAHYGLVDLDEAN